jgi:D-alanyl-D-alanine carboxypeptidase/D-alanyl-D-alanine-endopeptidase (penicillin-binding protein 4)
MHCFTARRARAGAAVLGLSMIAVPLCAQAEFTALQKLESQGAQVTAEVYDLDNSKTIQSLNSGQRLAPASVTKIAITAAALDAWPADKVFKTRLVGLGAVQKNLLAGDIVLQSEGDATFDHESLWMLATQIKGSGIDTIAGKLIVNPPYGPLTCDNLDRCEAMERSDTAYNVPLAAVGIDYGTWCVDVRATEVGKTASVRGCGIAQLPIPVVGEIKTVAANQKNTFWVERRTSKGEDSLFVGGNVPQGQDQRVYRAMSNPALGAGLTLREMLAELNVDISKQVDLRYGELPESAHVMAETEGLALREQLGRMMRYSNNYIADLLTLNLGAVRLPKPPGQLSDAGKALADFVASKRLTKTSGKNDAPKLLSGSGLTPENQLSADDLIGLLVHQYRETSTFPVFYGQFVVPRQAPFAFVRQGNADWLDRVTLKTGTMNDPRSVCGIAGYLRKKNGGWMAFAVIVNGGPKVKRIPLYKSMEAARTDIQSVLARY